MLVDVAGLNAVEDTTDNHPPKRKIPRHVKKRQGTAASRVTNPEDDG